LVSTVLIDSRQEAVPLR